MCLRTNRFSDAIQIQSDTKLLFRIQIRNNHYGNGYTVQ